MRRYTTIALCAALAAVLLGSSGCVLRREPVPESEAERTRSYDADLGNAETSRVTIEMGAGELTLSGADLGTKAFEGEFSFRPASLEPEFDSTVDSSEVEVNVSSPDLGRRSLMFGRNFRNEWDLSLAEGIPTDLTLNLGAGDATLDLSTVDVTDLDVDMGAGEATIDLTGDRTNDVEGTVTQGAGDVTVRLPEGVGVRVFGRSDGVGEWNYEGFRQDGDYLVNDAYGETDVTIELDVQRGVGEVTLELVD